MCSHWTEHYTLLGRSPSGTQQTCCDNVIYHAGSNLWQGELSWVRPIRSWEGRARGQSEKRDGEDVDVGK